MLAEAGRPCGAKSFRRLFAGCPGRKVRGYSFFQRRTGFRAAVTSSKIADGAVTSAKVADQSAGGALAGTYPNPSLAAGAVTPAAFGTVPAAGLRNSTDTPIPFDDTSFKLPFNTETFDSANLHNPAQPTRLTAPVTGVYVISAGVAWTDSTPASTKLYTMTFQVNGTTKIASRDDHPLSFAVFVQSLSVVAKLTAGDFVELFLYQDDVAGANAPESQSTGPNPRFSMAWVGPG